MATRRTSPKAEASPTAGKEVNGEHSAVAPRALALTQRGIRTGEDFADLMSALMSDLIEGNISPMIANATVNAGGKLLKVVEMQYRYGNRGDQRERALLLSPGR